MNCLNCAHLRYSTHYPSTDENYEFGGFTCAKLHYNGEQMPWDVEGFRALFAVAEQCGDFKAIGLAELMPKKEA